MALVRYILLAFGLLLWQRPWRQHNKIPPMRAEYLEGSGPMRELHSLPEDPAEVVEAEGQKQVDVNSDPGTSGRDNSTRQFGIF